MGSIEYEICAGCAVDCRAPSHSTLERYAQQSRLSPGDHARATHVQRTQPWGRSWDRWIDAVGSQYRLHESGARHGLHGEGPITDPRDLGPAIVARLQQLNAANR